MFVTKTFDAQEMMNLIREALEARGYKVEDIELQWKSRGTFDTSTYCRVEVGLNV